MAISALGGNSHPTSNGSDPSEPGQVHGTLTSSLTDCLCRLIETNAEAQTVKGKREDNLKTASYAPQASEDNHKNLVDPPEDPLLKSICFIETNVVRNGETLIGAETVDLQTASHASQSCGVGAPDGDSNWAGEVRPALDNSAPLSESQPRRGRKRASEATASMASVEREDWLPPGWIVEGRVRSSGASAGSRDKVDIDCCGVSILFCQSTLATCSSSARPRKDNETLANTVVEVCFHGLVRIGYLVERNKQQKWKTCHTCLWKIWFILERLPGFGMGQLNLPAMG
ncbi:hypothetical protein CK203_070554 [Vitis vinifera]|uniref:Uncharacterized protein n=1 Tax=Vitis vinifera TaxID=29760 RepID=A0A438FAU1_VITVI|nr:hypothetical protein CK203_070554 [Vitis vinifera]